MNKQNVGDVVAIASPDVRVYEFTPEHAQLAEWLRLDLSGSADVRTDRAVQAVNGASMRMLEAGLLLASVHAELGTDAFSAHLEARAIPKRRGYELMAGAAWMAKQPPADRERVLGLGKSKVLLLASADPVVVQAALESDEVDLDLLSVRALRNRLRELEAKITDVAVQRDRAEADLEAQRKRTSAKRTDQVPVVIAGFRQELAIAVERARLALDTVRGVLADCQQLDGGAGPWVDGTARLAAGGVASLQIELAGAMDQCLEMLPEGEIQFTAEARLSPQEVTELAERWHAEAGADRLEAQQREVMRANAARTGPGRKQKVPTK